MQKRIAIINVIAWAGFWTFGYLAVSTRVDAPGQMVTATILAAIGGGAGMVAYFRLVRHAEATGHARPAGRARRRDDDIHGEVL